MHVIAHAFDALGRYGGAGRCQLRSGAPDGLRPHTISGMEERLKQLAALVALLRLPKASWPQTAASAIERGDAYELLLEQLDEEGALFPLDAPVEVLLAAAAADIQEWEAEGISVHGCLDAAYPAQLRDVHQVPPLLFTRGRLEADRRAVAVVGTRKASPDGIRIAQAIARSLAEADVTVVSGLAKGIDTAAHTAALEAGGRTVAVIGTGIRKSYPAENRDLQEQIAAQGLLISQFWPDSPPTKTGFPMRNAVMSGYAAATVVVEAEHRSGARMQARLALEHGRPVVLPQELLVHDWARDYAQRPGVYVVTGIQELLSTVELLTTRMSPNLESLSELAQFAVPRS